MKLSAKRNSIKLDLTRSLDFDKEYLEEELILRDQKGFDKFGNLMLPPRSAGTGLPEELKKKPEVQIVDESENAEQQQVEVIEKHDPVQFRASKHISYLIR